MNCRKRHFDSHLFFGFLAGTIVGFAVFFILDVPINFIYAAVSGALTFFLYSYLTIGNTSFGFKSFYFSIKSFSNVPLFAVFYAFVITSVAIIKPVSNEFLLFIEWNNIPLLNWVRIIGSLLLIFFLPGYVILKLFRVKLAKIPLSVLSYLLSLFLVALLAISAMLIGVSLEKDGLALLLSFNVLLLILYLLNVYIRKPDVSSEKNFRRCNLSGFFTTHNMVLLGVVVIVLMLYSTTVSYIFPFFGGDMTTHNGAALNFIKEGIASATYPTYPYLFQVNLASFYVLSGVPSINAYDALSFFIIMPYLALYSMVSAFFKSRKIPAIATVFTIFGGFGWERIVAEKALNFPGLPGMRNLIESVIGWGVSMLMWFPSELDPIFLIGIPSFLMLVYLSRCKNISKYTCGFLIVGVTVVGFMSHIIEVAVFAMILALLFILSSRKEFKFGLVAISMTTGLLLIAFLDMLAPARNYLSQTGSHFSVFLLTMGLSIFVAMFSYFERKLRITFTVMTLQKYFRARTKRIFSAVLLFLLIYSYGLCYLVWTQTDPLINRSTTVDVNSVIFSYPTKMGVAGILSIGCIAYLLFRKKANNEPRRFDFFLTLGFMSVLLIMGAPLLFPNTTGLLRPPIYLMMAVSVLAAAALTRLFSWLKKRSSSSGKKKLVVVGLLSIIVVSSIANPLLYYGEENSVWATGRYNILTDARIEAFEFLERNVLPNQTIGVFDSYTQYMIAGYTGINQGQIGYVGLSATPALALQRLNECQVKYIVVDKTIGIPAQCQDSFEARYLLNWLKIAFENAAYIIYEVPPSLSYPTTSQLALVTPNETLLPENLSLNKNVVMYLPLDSSSENFVVSGINSSSPFWVEGKYGEAANFDGIDDYLFLGDHNFTYLNSEKGAISFWFKPTWNVYSYAGSAVLSGINGTDDNSFRLYFDPSGSLHLYIIKNGTMTVNIWTQQTSWDQNTWYYIVVTQDVNNNTKIYVNGIDDTVVGTDDNHWFEGITTYQNFWICRFQNNYQSGILDDLKIYNESLSEKDVLQYFDPAQFAYQDIYLPSLSMLALSGYRYDVTASDAPFSYSALVLPYDPPNDSPIDNYVSWVRGGGHLIVLNTLGHASFSSIMGISQNGGVNVDAIFGSTNGVELTNMSTPLVYATDEKNTKVIAQYAYNGKPVSPFAFQETIGNGSITYVEMESIVSSVLDSNSSRQTWGNLGLLMKSLNLVFLNSLTNLPSSYSNLLFDFFRGTANFTGDVRIDSPSFNIPNDKSLYVKHLTSSNELNYVFNGSTSNQTDYSSDLLIKNVDVLGEAQSTLFSSEAEIVPQSSYYDERYILVNLNTEFNWTMALPEGQLISLDCSKGDLDYQIILEGGKINLFGATSQNVSDSFSILTMAPLVYNQGISYFDYLSLYMQHTTTQIINNKVIINGEIDFQTTLSGNGSSLSQLLGNTGPAVPYATFSSFVINGKVTQLYMTLRSGITRYQYEWYQLSYPWQSALISWSNIVLLIASLVSVLLIYALSDSTIRMRLIKILFWRNKRKCFHGG